jgi:structural protein KPP10_ORF10
VAGGVGSTYSFKSLVGVLQNAVFGVTIPLTGGNIGVGDFTITMATERTSHDVAADGTVMPSYIAGDNGTLSINVQETSILHKALLGLYNLAVLAANQDDVLGWAATTVSFTFLIDGSIHLLSGVSFAKVPDKPYQSHGQRITWNLMAANIINT